MKPTSVYILDDEESKMVDRIKLYIKSRIEDGMRLKGITDEVEEDKEDVSIRKEGIRIVREMKRYIDAKKAMKSSATTGEGGSSHDKLEERTIKDTQILNSNKKAATTSEGGSSHDQLEERTIKELTQILNSNQKAATTSEGGSSHDQLEERMIKELTQILNSNKKAISDRMDLLTTRMGRLEESDTPDGMTPSKDKDTGKGASVEIVEFDCCYKAFWSNSTTFKGLQKGHSRVEANLGRGEKKKEDKMEEGKSKNKKKDCKPENKKRHNV